MVNNGNAVVNEAAKAKLPRLGALIPT